MRKSIEGLNRDTIARNNGIETDAISMNHFCKLIFNQTKCSKESYYQRLLWISTYEGLNPELSEQIRERLHILDEELSKGITYEEGSKVR